MEPCAFHFPQESNSSIAENFTKWPFSIKPAPLCSHQNELLHFSAFFDS